MTAHKNFMNGTSFDISNPLVRLRIAASSCFFGEPTYYAEARRTGTKADTRAPMRVSVRLGVADRRRLNGNLNNLTPVEWKGKNAAGMLETTIDQALEFDIEGTLAFAAQLRNKLNMRKTPQVIMVRAANHPKSKGTSLIREYGSRIIFRLDDVMTQAEYQLEKFGKPIPSRLKRAWARRLESAKDYELAKYRREGHKVNIYDVVNLTHPKSESINSLMRGELKLGGDNQTWESIRAAGGTWNKAAEVMGHMALLRNLRNLQDAGIVEEYLDKLQEGVARGRQLPFRYYSAYQAIQSKANPVTLEAVENCVEKSIVDNLPHFHGKVMSLSDNSGSAWGALTSQMGTMQVATIGNLMSVLTAKAADEGYVGVFGDRLIRRAVNPSSRVFDVLDDVQHKGREVGGATENGIWLFWNQAITQKEHWDHVFVYSDMQAGHGGLFGLNPKDYEKYMWNHSRHIDVPALIAKYRTEVNPDVMVYLVQTAGYQDSLVPEFYNRTFILGGWSENILHFAAEMNEIFG